MVERIKEKKNCVSNYFFETNSNIETEIQDDIQLNLLDTTKTTIQN